MILRCLICSLLGLSLANNALAQQKQLSMEDALVKNKTTLLPQNLSDLQFINGTDEYVYQKKSPKGNVWMKGSFSKDAAEYLNLHALNSKMKNLGLDTFKTMPTIAFDKESWTVSLKNTKYRLNVANQNYSFADDTLYSKQTNAAKSADGYYAYLKNDNFFVAKSGDEQQVTKDGSADIVYASSVHQNEWGIEKGIFWSNDGKKVAFYKMDQSMVKPYPIIDWKQTPAKANVVKYPMAAGANHEVMVGVYNAVAKQTIWLATPTPLKEYFLTNIAWSPDDKTIYIAVVNRQQNEMWLNAYNATSGEFIKTLFRKTDEKYVEPLHPMQFLPTKNNQFIWQENTDGWNHIYLYNTDGKLVKQLTKGNWEVIDVKGIDAKGENVYYTSTQVSPITKNLYAVNIKSGKTKQLTNDEGTHTVTLSKDLRFAIDNFSSTTNPRTIKLIDLKTGKQKQLLQAENPLKDYALGELSIFTIKNKVGDDIYCRMYKPVGFDSTKKYPTVVYWYGGPHAQMILNSWNGGASDYWFQAMAQRGFLVFSIDTRGSENRGKAFEQVIHRRTGEPQKEDMDDAVAFLHSKSFVDTEKMGLFGWSYGGFMTTNYLLSKPNVFKVGVAGGPVMDWSMYEIMYGERYMDMVEENLEGYNATNLIKKAGNLKDNLLVIHGTQDPVVVMQHSVNFVKACVDAGVQVDFMVYPGHEHNVSGKDRAHLFQKITDYFTLHLK